MCQDKGVCKKEFCKKAAKEDKAAADKCCPPKKDANAPKTGCGGSCKPN